MASIQQTLRLTSTKGKQEALRINLVSFGFDFSGRAKHERRDGQFQYRYGKKVQPKDRNL